jgi:hypothetical protein
MSDSVSDADRVMDFWGEAIDALADMESAAAQAEVAYRNARAVAYEKATGTAAARGYQVDRATADESLARYEAAAAVKVQYKRIDWWKKKADLRHTDIVNERAFTGKTT